MSKPKCVTCKKNDVVLAVCPPLEELYCFECRPLFEFQPGKFARVGESTIIRDVCWTMAKDYVWVLTAAKLPPELYFYEGEDTDRFKRWKTRWSKAS